MHSTYRIALLGAGSALIASVCLAQQPQRSAPPAGPRNRATQPANTAGIVARLMAFDKNGDGKLTRAEITDARLLRLFDRADANKDGVVTREELTALADKMAAESPASAGPGGGSGGPDGFGPPGGQGGVPGFGPPPGEFGGPGGPGGPRGFGGPPQPGQILPAMLQQRLNLTDEQKQKLEALQKEVDKRLGAILTDEQKQQLQQLGTQRGPGPRGFGGPGGPGPGGP